jgi:hypothetical protein
MWTGIMAFVLLVTTRSICRASILKVSGEYPKTTGFAPTLEMASAVAKNVKGGGYHLVAFTDAACMKRQDQCVRAVCTGNCMPGADITGYLILQPGNFFSHDKAGALKDVGYRLVYFFLYLQVLSFQIDQRDHLKNFLSIHSFISNDNDEAGVQ